MEGILWRSLWAVVGLLFMAVFFSVFEDFTRDRPPLWLQVAVAVGGVGAWLKLGDQKVDLAGWAKGLLASLQRAWANWPSKTAEAAIAILFVIFTLYMFAVHGFKKAPEKKSYVEKYLEEERRLNPHRFHPPPMDLNLKALEAAEKERTH